MKFSSVFVVILCLLAPGIRAGEAGGSYYDQLFERANEAYKAAQYDSAKTLYSEIVNNGFVSPVLYYNLANAHFKDGNIPASILYLERARRLAPADGDILYNLEVANSFVSDKIEAVDPIFINQWWTQLAQRLSTTAWAWIFIALLSACAVFFTLFFVSPSRQWRQLGFLGGLFCLALATGALALGYKGKSLLEKEEAVVFAASVNVKSEPSLNATVQFVIHEGLKVEVEDSEGEWVRIKLADGNSGWIPNQSIERI